MKNPPVTIEGESLTQAKWAAKLGVTRGAIHFRQKKYGETPEQAVLHFYNKKRRRNIEKFHTAAEAEAAARGDGSGEKDKEASEPDK